MQQYRLIDFLRDDAITISTSAQNAPHYPFTLQSARHFFKHFEDAVFEVDFPTNVLSIYITSGKNALPRHSFAHGYLLSVPLSVYEERGLQGIPDPLDTIHFEFGGNTTSPRVWLDSSASRPKPMPSPRREPAPEKGRKWHRGGKGLVFLALLLVALATWQVLKARGNRDRSGFRPVNDAAAATGSLPPISVAWAHDLSFSWWQPVHHEGAPVWVDKGDVIRFAAAPGQPHKYRRPNGGDPVAFGWQGTRTVRQTRKNVAGQLLNRRPDARLLGLQARTSLSKPPLSGTNTCRDLSTAEALSVVSPGFLFLCPNVPHDGGFWGCSGVCQLTLTIFSGDGSLAPPESIVAPSMHVTLERQGHVRTAPSTGASVLTVAEAGSALACVGRSGEWYEVRIASDGAYRQAWLHESLVSRCEVR